MTTEIAARILYDRLQTPNDIILLDVRNSDDFARWRIETRHTPETINIPYFEFIEDDTREAALGRLPVGHAIITVCAHGGSSDYVAAILRERGRDAVSLAGGMEAWAQLQVFRPVIETSLFSIYQGERVARGCLSYVVISHGQAGVIDATRHVEDFERFLDSQDAALNWVVDTHAHADHISGGAVLARRNEAAYYLHPYDATHPLDFLPVMLDFQALDDGQELLLGDVQLQVLHMPGHTLGQVNLLLQAEHAGAYLFSADNLFIRSLGRPDLGGQPEAWAGMLHDSIFHRLRAAIPTQSLVLPGHIGSPQDANPNGVYARTLGEIWTINQDLCFPDESEFIQHILTHLPETPPEYAEIKRINIGLTRPGDEEIAALEIGKNICGLSPSGLSIP